MKRIKIFALSLTMIFSVMSCEFGNTNVDPARPLDVGMAALLPSLETGLSFAVGGEYVLFSNILMQQVKGGTTAQQGDFTRYIIGGGDTDGMWQNMYTNSLNMAYIIMNKAEDENAPHYAGVSKVLMAAGIGVITDTFGDIPYSQAFRADEGVVSEFDTQANVYASIQSLLDEAIVDLQAADSPGGSPGGDDLIYGGDLDAWIAAAKSLKAKYYLHLSKVDASAYDDVLATINDGVIDSESGDLRQFFTAGAHNPRYEFDLNRAGNIFMGDFFVNKLVNDNDPREGQLNTINDGYWTGPGAPVAFVTYSELKMIEAEALLMTGAALSEVKAAMLEGSRASIQEVTGLSEADPDVAAYLADLEADFDAATTDNERLGVIINEKYVITFSTGVEPWVDYRRTGFPALTPNPEGDRATNPGGAVPRRLPYPDNERLLNTKIPFKEINMQMRMYWDE